MGENFSKRSDYSQYFSRFQLNVFFVFPFGMCLLYICINSVYSVRVGDPKCLSFIFDNFTWVRWMVVVVVIFSSFTNPLSFYLFWLFIATHTSSLGWVDLESEVTIKLSTTPNTDSFALSRLFRRQMERLIDSKMV